MSRIGRSPVTVPEGVTVDIAKDMITVKGPKGELSEVLLPEVSASMEGQTLTVARKDDEKQSRARHGLTRSLIQNMVTGVSEGFNKQLEINGVGFKANMNGSNLKLALGFSHDVIYEVPEGVSVTAKDNVITVEGSSKQQVGQVAAEIRALKKPEPYKGKGIKYVGEYIIRKSGKAAGGAE